MKSPQVSPLIIPQNAGDFVNPSDHGLLITLPKPLCEAFLVGLGALDDAILQTHDGLFVLFLWLGSRMKQDETWKIQCVALDISRSLDHEFQGISLLLWNLPQIGTIGTETWKH